MTTNAPLTFRTEADILANQNTNWLNAPTTLNAGEQIIVEFTVEFTAGGELGPYQNKVTVSGEDVLGQANVSGEGTEDVQIEVEPGLTVDKELVSTEILGQNQFRSVFTLTVESDSEVMGNVELLENLVDGWTAAGTTAEVSDIRLVSSNVAGGTWTLEATPVTNSATALLATAASLPANSASTFEITIDYTVDAADLGLLPIENTAIVTGNDPAGNAVSGQDTVIVEEQDLIGDTSGPQLVVNKAGVDPVPNGGSNYLVDFTITINNPGDETAYALELTDDLAGTLGLGDWENFVVTAISAENVDTAIAIPTRSAGDITSDPTTNWFTGTPQLPAGQEILVEFTVTFDVGDDNDANTAKTGPYTNIAVVTGENALGVRDLSDEGRAAILITLDSANISLDKEHVSTTVRGQNEFRSIFSIRLENTSGQDLVSGEIFDDTALAGWGAATAISYVPGSASFVAEAPAGVWTINPGYAAGADPLATAANIPAGATVTIEFAIDYTILDPGLLPLTNLASATIVDSFGDSHEATDATSLYRTDIIGEGEQLVLVKDGGFARPVAGSNGRYEVDFTVTLKNPTTSTAYDVLFGDDLQTTLGAGAWNNFAVTSATAENVTSSTAVAVTPTVDGSNWFDNVTALGGGETIRIDYTVEFDANGDLGPCTKRVLL